MKCSIISLELEEKIARGNSKPTLRVACGGTVYLNTQQLMQDGQWEGPEYYLYPLNRSGADVLSESSLNQQANDEAKDENSSAVTTDLTAVVTVNVPYLTMKRTSGVLAVSDNIPVRIWVKVGIRVQTIG
ncbi:hypothetical protein PoB_002030900 [Plakobranchus ocellatus]|uniref:Uncharacterized protein n=1 Tax=Plakobranchus ocellatus TaxID=259542 RepID=A0AAV3ZIU5_9GAST|nr:hypothetical protein PoB_002030900 [Plakobranchus ocellatus]